MDNSRRDFMKRACMGTLCMCGLSRIAQADVIESIGEDISKKEMSTKWILEVLNNIDKSLNEEQRRAIIKSASIAEYENIKVEETMSQYKGDIDKFIIYLEKEWGWKCHFEENKKILIADENKSFCVCPFMKNNMGKLYPAMCYCSEGFAEKMFSYIIGHPVAARVISSVQWGNERCIYRIEI